MLQRFCDISIRRADTENYRDVIAVVKQQLEAGLPAAVYISTFWCPWHGEYQKLDHRHYCLAIGIEEDTLMCIDPALSPEICRLPLKDFENGFGPCMVFEINEEDKNRNYSSILKESVEKLEKSDFLSKFQIFIQDFKEKFDYRKEFSNFEISLWDVLFFRNMTYVAGSRILYSRFIALVANITKNQELNEIANKLMISKSKLDVIRSLLVKGHHTVFTDRMKDKTASMLESVVELESNIINGLGAISQSIELAEIGVDPVEVQEKEIYIPEGHTFVDLRKHFNNIAFHSIISNDCAADITGTGHYFLSQNAPAGQVIKVNNMSFAFPEIKDDIPDNVMCQGQVIELPGTSCKGIMFLGCCEWGSCFDFGKLNFNDNESRDIQINFSDWAIATPVFDEYVAWRGPVYDKTVSNILHEKNNLFALFRPIHKNDQLQSITLPQCPNMHIFAVTLC
ncbi:MAG: hypothetical protein K0R50_2817 [Eubacterium sp.]|nr:hypothetical protein [Eubacterium sp.]